MLHKYLSETLVSPDALTSDSGDWLRLEQTDIETPEGGYLGWAVDNDKEIFSAVTLAEYNEEFKSYCSEDGSLDVDVEIHKSRADLEYEISASYGELGDKHEDRGETKESITVEKTESYDLEELVDGDVSGEWEGKVYNENNQSISPPEITVSGLTLSWGIVCTGVIRLQYEYIFDTYTLHIIPRDEEDYEDLDGAYQSTVLALWSGGIETLEISLPDMTGNCNGESSTSVDPDDPDKDLCYNLYVTRDKCTNEILEENLVQVVCPEDEEG